MKLSEDVLKYRVFRKKAADLLAKQTILSKLDPYLHKDKAAIDVGAAVGHITYYLAPRSRSVWAFEAVRPVCDQLDKMKSVYPNIVTVNEAVSDFQGKAEFYVDDKRLSNSGFQDLVGGQKIEVGVSRLDDYFIPRIGFVKIDVEGTEFDVLKGAERVIGEHRPAIMVEIYEPYTKYPVGTIFGHLMNKGYKCFYYAHPDLVEVPDVPSGVQAVMMKHHLHDGDFLFV